MNSVKTNRPPQSGVGQNKVTICKWPAVKNVPTREASQRAENWHPAPALSGHKISPLGRARYRIGPTYHREGAKHLQKRGRPHTFFHNRKRGHPSHMMALRDALHTRSTQRAKRIHTVADALGTVGAEGGNRSCTAICHLTLSLFLVCPSEKVSGEGQLSPHQAPHVLRPC